MRKVEATVRRNLPVPLRQSLRAVRAMTAPIPPSPALPAELIEECRFVASRHALIAELPKGGEVAEIGVLRGGFARHILATAAPRHLHLFDIDLSPVAADVASDPRVNLHEGASPGALSVLADGSMDWIYIDGDHSYPAVAADAAAAANKVKPGGYLVFNDFAHCDPQLGRYGVHRAVVEFAVREGWRFAFFAYQPNALYDVALRGPE